MKVLSKAVNNNCNMSYLNTVGKLSLDTSSSLLYTAMNCLFCISCDINQSKSELFIEFGNQCRLFEPIWQSIKEKMHDTQRADNLTYLFDNWVPSTLPTPYDLDDDPINAQLCVDQLFVNATHLLYPLAALELLHHYWEQRGTQHGARDNILDISIGQVYLHIPSIYVSTSNIIKQTNCLSNNLNRSRETFGV